MARRLPPPLSTLPLPVCPWRAFYPSPVQHATFFTRLHHFVLISDAYIVAPGGLGTLLETMMIWQLLQTRHLHDTPLILAGPMWKGLVEWATATMLRPGFEMASPQDEDTVLRGQRRGSGCRYPGPPRTLVDCAG